MPTIQEIRSQFPTDTARKTDWDIVVDLAEANKMDLRSMAGALGAEIPTEETGLIDSVQGGFGKLMASAGAGLQGDFGIWMERKGREVAERNPVSGSGLFEATAGIASVILLFFLFRWSSAKLVAIKNKTVAPALVSDLVSPLRSTPLSDDDESIYAAIADEIGTGNVSKGLWTKLSAECDFDDTKTKARYIKHRFIDIKSKSKK